jgi:formylglycine-generating enzyme required for sulfatase activity
MLMGAGAASASITIATVQVGNAGNAADSTGFGAVSYNYNIGKYDVTSSQYTAFLNAVAASDPNGLYNSGMAGTSDGLPGIVQSDSSGNYMYSVTGGRGNYPVTDVTFWDACRFANWLANGQPTGAEGTGTTETGTYTLTSADIANNTVTRNAGATWAVTSHNEWYKAAYYTPLGGTGNSNPNYWLYPTQSNTISTSQANYDSADTTPVGSYSYPSYYGTYDQGGDVFQWNESVYAVVYRGVRGGAFDYNGDDIYLQSGTNFDDTPSDIFSSFGFRVSQVPEPTTLGLMGLAALSLMGRRRKATRRRWDWQSTPGFYLGARLFCILGCTFSGSCRGLHDQKGNRRKTSHSLQMSVLQFRTRIAP